MPREKLDSVSWREASNYLHDMSSEAKVKIRSEERRGTSQQKMEVSINGLSSKVKVASLEIQVDFQNGESVQQRCQGP